MLYKDSYVYRHKNMIKVMFLALAMIIGTLSVLYTGKLVNELAEREQKMIDLYAKGFEYIAKADDVGNLAFLFQEIIEANNSVPVILANPQGDPVSHKNIRMPAGITKEEENLLLKAKIIQMAKQHEPIKIEFAPGIYNYVYYQNSFLLTELKYYPLAQLSVIAVFAVTAYLAFSWSRNAEQNKVWVGLAKETAHQLGTPLSSLMGWLEIFKADNSISSHAGIPELEKDIRRLEMVTARFSSIGSTPKLAPENINDSIRHTIKYLQTRISKRIVISTALSPYPLPVLMNKALFDWVIENLCKNAVDAMGPEGQIIIESGVNDVNNCFIDVCDTGKGIDKNKVKQIFMPGFTTKARGWGLGLTLTKRIVEDYHKGKIFVKHSGPEGTVFRIILPLVKEVG